MSGQSSLDCLNAFRFECPNILLQFSETLANCHFQPLLKVKNNNVSISYNSLINSADLTSPLFTRLKVDNIIYLMLIIVDICQLVSWVHYFNPRFNDNHKNLVFFVLLFVLFRFFFLLDIKYHTNDCVEKWLICISQTCIPANVLQ